MHGRSVRVCLRRAVWEVKIIISKDKAEDERKIHQ